MSKMNKRVYGVLGISSVMANWNADFSGFPKTTTKGQFFGSDKALKFPMKKMWEEAGEKVLNIKSFTVSKPDKNGAVFLVPRTLKERYEYIFGVEDMKKDKDIKVILKNLFSAIDVKNFGSTFAEADANISITGWQANWTAESAAPEDAIVLNDKIWGEKPYQIKSEINAKVVPGNTYKLKFTVNNGMMEADTTTKTEKNITITVNSGIEGDNDNTMLFKTITVPAGATETYEFDVPVSPDYLSNDIKVQLAYGSNYYSYELTQAVKAGKVTEEAAKACKYAYAYGTSENVNAHGTLAFTDISLMGEKYTQSVIPERQTTKAPETTTAVPTTAAPTAVPTPTATTAATTATTHAVIATAATSFFAQDGQYPESSVKLTGLLKQ